MINSIYDDDDINIINHISFAERVVFLPFIRRECGPWFDFWCGWMIRLSVFLLFYFIYFQVKFYLFNEYKAALEVLYVVGLFSIECFILEKKGNSAKFFNIDETIASCQLHSYLICDFNF